MITQNSKVETLEDFVQRLDELGIQYMITGSFAVHAYATGRPSNDIDAFVATSSASFIDSNCQMRLRGRT